MFDHSNHRSLLDVLVATFCMLAGFSALSCGPADTTQTECPEGEVRSVVGDGPGECRPTCNSAADCSSAGTLCTHGVCVDPDDHENGTASGASSGSDSDSTCGPGEKEVDFRGETSCYPTCDTESDCEDPSAECTDGACLTRDGGTSGDGSSSGGTTSGSSTGTTTTGTSTGDSGGSSSDSCQAILECQRNCGRDDTQCQRNCVESASSSAQEDYSALVSCVREKCSNANDVNACAREQCTTQLQACAGSGGTSGGSSGGSTSGSGSTSGGSTGSSPESCQAILECQRSCSQGDTACQQSCVQNASSSAQQNYNDLTTCYQNKCASSGSPQECMRQQCSSQLQACFGSGGSTGGSSGSTTGSSSGSTSGGSTGGTPETCAEILSCQQNCPSGDRECAVQCVEQAPSSARQTYSDLAACYRNQCSGASDPNQCLQSNCSAELQACSGGGSTSGGSTSGGSTGGSSPQTCQEIIGCQQNCARGDQQCVDSCYQTAPSTAQQNYDALDTCYQNNCSGSQSPQQCLENQCSTELQACTGSSSGGGTTGGSSGGTTGSSSLSCSEIIGCQQNCSDSDDTCVARCYQDGSTQGQSEYDALVECAQNQCSDASDPQACIEQQCSTELQACFG